MKLEFFSTLRLGTVFPRGTLDLLVDRHGDDQLVPTVAGQEDSDSISEDLIVGLTGSTVHQNFSLPV